MKLQMIKLSIETLMTTNTKSPPYKEGFACGKRGGLTKENPYWTEHEKPMNEWAFHSWLQGWTEGNCERNYEPSK
jgi:hypothetical protein